MDFKCIHCGTEYHASAQHAGSHIRCSRCEQIIQIPTTQRAQIVVAEPPGPGKPPDANEPEAQGNGREPTHVVEPTQAADCASHAIPKPNTANHWMRRAMKVSLAGIAFSIVLLSVNAAVYQWAHGRGPYRSIRENGYGVLTLSLAVLGTALAIKVAIASSNYLSAWRATIAGLRSLRPRRNRWAVVALVGIAGLFLVIGGFWRWGQTDWSQYEEKPQGGAAASGAAKKSGDVFDSVARTLPADFSGFDEDNPSPQLDDVPPKKARPVKLAKVEPAPIERPRAKYNSTVPISPATDVDPAAYNRLPSGTNIAEDVGRSGLGKLTVENGTTLDAVVRLVRNDNGQTARWFYVQAHSKETRGGIEPGSYSLVYTTGADWDGTAVAFRRSASYDAFDRQCEYLETPDGEDITRYRTISVTLQPVPDGNARTRRISREEFLSGHKNQPFSR